MAPKPRNPANPKEAERSALPGRRLSKAEDWLACPALGPGWKRRENFRKRGATCGLSDTYYMSPTGKRIRSKVELARFLGPDWDLSTFHFKLGVLQPSPARARRRQGRPRKNTALSPTEQPEPERPLTEAPEAEVMAPRDAAEAPSRDLIEVPPTDLAEAPPGNRVEAPPDDCVEAPPGDSIEASPSDRVEVPPSDRAEAPHSDGAGSQQRRPQRRRRLQAPCGCCGAPKIPFSGEWRNSGKRASFELPMNCVCSNVAAASACSDIDSSPITSSANAITLSATAASKSHSLKVVNRAPAINEASGAAASKPRSLKEVNRGPAASEASSAAASKPQSLITEVSGTAASRPQSLKAVNWSPTVTETSEAAASTTATPASKPRSLKVVNRGPAASEASAALPSKPRSLITEASATAAPKPQSLKAVNWNPTITEATGAAASAAPASKPRSLKAINQGLAASEASTAAASAVSKLGSLEAVTRDLAASAAAAPASKLRSLKVVNQGPAASEASAAAASKPGSLEGVHRGPAAAAAASQPQGLEAVTPGPTASAAAAATAAATSSKPGSLKVVPGRSGCGLCAGCQSQEDCGQCWICVREGKPGLIRRWRCLRRRCLQKHRRKRPKGLGTRKPPGRHRPAQQLPPLTQAVNPVVTAVTTNRCHWGQRRSRKCGACAACLRLVDCGECDFCLDKPKFGGGNQKRQKCRWRQCLKFALKRLLPAIRSSSSEERLALALRQPPRFRKGTFGNWPFRSGWAKSRGHQSEPRSRRLQQRKPPVLKEDLDTDFIQPQETNLVVLEGGETVAMLGPNAKSEGSPLPALDSIHLEEYESLGLETFNTSPQLKEEVNSFGSQSPETTSPSVNFFPEQHSKETSDSQSQQSVKEEEDLGEEEDTRIPKVMEICSLDKPRSTAAGLFGTLDSVLQEFLVELNELPLPAHWEVLPTRGPDLCLIQRSILSTVAAAVIHIQPGLYFRVVVRDVPVPPTHELYAAHPLRITTVDEVIELICNLEAYRLCPGWPNSWHLGQRSPRCDVLVYEGRCPYCCRKPWPLGRKQ
ncbi:uncharacterized protein LOC130458424 [Monodelphis domestica]|uniref:uncharacterized protein LOC130458424 n=1 Tax=Monodelphis domestica TaxID=13616 RepID=UPI0024E1E5B9|nr:uncharacterized protein LOC130458424 [Monodelphis domestica]